MRRMHTVRARTITAQGKSVVASLTHMGVVVCCSTVFSAMGCNRSGGDTTQEPSPIEALAIRDVPANAVAESQLRGGKVYKHYCAICHGYEGQGNGFNSTNLAVPPRDFSNPQFWREATDEHLLLTVSKGGTAVGKSVLMPAWGRTLTDRQMRDVVAYLHTLAPSGQPREKGSGPLKW
jgi:cytochrome c oxidase cbb3-type subunit III